MAEFIRAEIKKGTIPDEVPGIQISKSAGLIAFQIKDLAVSLDPQNAKGFARDVERMASEPVYIAVRRNDGKVSDIYPGDLWVNDRSNSHMLVRRRGRGVVLELRSGRRTTELSLNPKDALELSRLIRQVAK